MPDLTRPLPELETPHLPPATLCSVCKGHKYIRQGSRDIGLTQCYNCSGTGVEPFPVAPPPPPPKVDPNAPPCPGCGGSGYRGPTAPQGNLDSVADGPVMVHQQAMQCSDCGGSGKYVGVAVTPITPKPPEPSATPPVMPYTVVMREFVGGSGIYRASKQLPGQRIGQAVMLTQEEELVWRYVQWLEGKMGLLIESSKENAELRASLAGLKADQPAIAAIQDELDAMRDNRDAWQKRLDDIATERDKLKAENAELKELCGEPAKPTSETTEPEATPHQHGKKKR